MLPNSSASKVLLVLPSYGFMYKNTVVRVGVEYFPSLSLATLAGALVSKGVEVQILDLNVRREQDLEALVKTSNFDHVGFTFTTPLADETLRLAKSVKKIKPGTIVMTGGSHASALPEQVLKSGVVDVVCIGEGDHTVLDIVQGKPYEMINGIAFRRGDAYHVTSPRGPIYDLDSLPFPAWNLFDLSAYKTTKLLSKKPLMGMVETSRGCPYGCAYCSKKIFGRNFRTKSIGRVVEEMAYMLACGFQEIHLADDCFSFDRDRAKGICIEIMRRQMKFPWTATNGLRVDQVDQELFDLMKRAGCYRISFGIESGDDAVLVSSKKGQTCEDTRRAVKAAKQAGLETFGFFMFALPGENEGSMRKTIDFSKELDLDMAKVSLAIPFPGTEYFEDLCRKGEIRVAPWSKYNIYLLPRDVYRHPNVDWDTVGRYLKKFYREFYLRPHYVVKRFNKGMRDGNLMSDAVSFLTTKW